MGQGYLKAVRFEQFFYFLFMIRIHIGKKEAHGHGFNIKSLEVQSNIFGCFDIQRFKRFTGLKNSALKTES